jgi:hypothetical protein
MNGTPRAKTSDARARPSARWTGAAGWVLLLAACSDHLVLPPADPDCNGKPDAACTLPPVAGAATTAPPRQPTEDSSVATGEEAGGACGTADSLLTGAAPSCAPCIETGAASSTGSDCCAADLACSNDVDCLAILRCAALCGSGNAGCIANCVSTTPAGTQDYDDFVLCLQLNCTQCPSLTPGTADF